MSNDYIAELQAVFTKLHNCDAEYVETVPVVAVSERAGNVSGNPPSRAT